MRKQTSRLRRRIRLVMQFLDIELSLVKSWRMFLNLVRAGLVRRRPYFRRNSEAFSYVGTLPAEGMQQLRILVYEGCSRAHHVLEIGCGTLLAGYPIIQYLDKARYCGIEPHAWLVEEALHVSEIDSAAAVKEARFFYNDRFDASEAGCSFDYIISHSVLTHCACWQLPLFLENSANVLRPGGKIIASVRFTEGNAFGSKGYEGTENDFQTWQYPSVSYFRRATVETAAANAGFECRVAEEYIRLMVRTRTTSIHDWIVLTKR